MTSRKGQWRDARHLNNFKCESILTVHQQAGGLINSNGALISASSGGGSHHHYMSGSSGSAGYGPSSAQLRNAYFLQTFQLVLDDGGDAPAAGAPGTWISITSTNSAGAVISTPAPTSTGGSSAATAVGTSGGTGGATPFHRGGLHQTAVIDFDEMPQWEQIRYVTFRQRFDDAYCPICLSQPVAARCTPCGHIFCAACIARHIHSVKEKQRGSGGGGSARSSSSSNVFSTAGTSGGPGTATAGGGGLVKCPLCHNPVTFGSLRPAFLTPIEPLVVGRRATFQLCYRHRLSSICFAISSPVHPADLDHLLGPFTPPAFGDHGSVASRLLVMDLPIPSSGGTSGGAGSAGGDGVSSPTTGAASTSSARRSPRRRQRQSDIWLLQHRMELEQKLTECLDSRDADDAIEASFLREALEIHALRWEAHAPLSITTQCLLGAGKVSPQPQLGPCFSGSSHGGRKSSSRPPTAGTSPTVAGGPTFASAAAGVSPPPSKAPATPPLPTTQPGGSPVHPPTAFPSTAAAACSSTTAPPSSGSAWIACYRAADGQQVYLDTVNFKMLQAHAELHRGGMLTPFVEVPVIDIISTTQTAATRSSQKGTAHVPLHGVFHVAHADLTDVVHSDVVARFQPMIDGKLQRREDARRRDERMQTEVEKRVAAKLQRSPPLGPTVVRAPAGSIDDATVGVGMVAPSGSSMIWAPTSSSQFLADAPPADDKFISLESIAGGPSSPLTGAAAASPPPQVIPPSVAAVQKAAAALAAAPALGSSGLSPLPSEPPSQSSFATASANKGSWAKGRPPVAATPPASAAPPSPPVRRDPANPWGTNVSPPLGSGGSAGAAVTISPGGSGKPPMAPLSVPMFDLGPSAAAGTSSSGGAPSGAWRKR